MLQRPARRTGHECADRERSRRDHDRRAVDNWTVDGRRFVTLANVLCTQAQVSACGHGLAPWLSTMVTT
jgi:hypothetical protein